MFYPESKTFKFDKIYSGVTLRIYNRSFGFRFHGCHSVSFFERTGSVVFANFHARSYIFE